MIWRVAERLLAHRPVPLVGPARRAYLVRGWRDDLLDHLGDVAGRRLAAARARERARATAAADALARRRSRPPRVIR